MEKLRAYNELSQYLLPEIIEHSPSSQTIGITVISSGMALVGVKMAASKCGLWHLLTYSVRLVHAFSW